MTRSRTMIGGRVVGAKNRKSIYLAGWNPKETRTGILKYRNLTQTNSILESNDDQFCDGSDDDISGMSEVEQLKHQVVKLQKRNTEKDKRINDLTSQLAEAGETLEEWDQYDCLNQNKNLALAERMKTYHEKYRNYKEKTKQRLKTMGVEERDEDDEDDEDDDLGDILLSFGINVKSMKKSKKDEDSGMNQLRYSTNYLSGETANTNQDTVGGSNCHFSTDGWPTEGESVTESVIEPAIEPVMESGPTESLIDDEFMSMDTEQDSFPAKRGSLKDFLMADIGIDDDDDLLGLGF